MVWRAPCSRVAAVGTVAITSSEPTRLIARSWGIPACNRYTSANCSPKLYGTPNPSRLPSTSPPRTGLVMSKALLTFRLLNGVKIASSSPSQFVFMRSRSRGQHGRGPFDGVDLGHDMAVDEPRRVEPLVRGPVRVSGAVADVGARVHAGAQQVGDPVVVHREQGVQDAAPHPPVQRASPQLAPAGIHREHPVGQVQMAVGQELARVLRVGSESVLGRPDHCRGPGSPATRPRTRCDT